MESHREMHKWVGHTNSTEKLLRTGSQDVVSCKQGKALIIATDILMVSLTFRARWSWTHDNSSSVCLTFVFNFHAIVTYTMIRRPMGARTKVMKVAVMNLLLVSTWSKAGAQDNHAICYIVIIRK